MTDQNKVSGKIINYNSSYIGDLYFNEKMREKTMKIIKIIILLITISFLTTVPTSANARDCSNPKGFHEKMMCKMSGQGNMISSETTKTKTDAQEKKRIERISKIKQMIKKSKTKQKKEY